MIRSLVYTEAYTSFFLILVITLLPEPPTWFFFFKLREHSQKVPLSENLVIINLLWDLSGAGLKIFLYCFWETRIFISPLSSLGSKFFKSASRLFVSSLNTGVSKHQPSTLCILFLHKPTCSNSFKCHCSTLTSKLLLWQHLLNCPSGSLVFFWLSGSCLELKRFFFFF